MAHPKFLGVAASVELLRRRNVKGERVEQICGDLEKHAVSHSAELVAAARAGRPRPPDTAPDHL